MSDDFSGEKVGQGADKQSGDLAAGQVASDSTPAEPRATESRTTDSGTARAVADAPFDSSIPTGVINAEVRAENSFVNSTFTGPVFFRDSVGEPLLSVDRTAEAAELSQRYVGSGTLVGLRRALSTGKVVTVVCGSAGSGKRSACLVALQRERSGPVVELPGDLSWKVLLRTIEQTKESAGSASFVMSNADAEFVESLDDFRMGSLEKALLKSSRSCLLVTTQGSLSRHSRSLNVMAGEAVPVRELVTAYFEMNPIDSSIMVRVHDLLDSVGSVSFSALHALVEKLRCRPTLSDPELLDELADVVVSNALNEWLANGRPARDVATLACVATCEGAPRTELDEEIRLLEATLLGESAAIAEPPVFGGTFAPGPAKGVVSVVNRSFSTHFGSQSEEVYVLERPLDRAAVIKYLWNELGSKFREAFLDWLRLLASARVRTLSVGAPLAAGVLLTVDPRYLEAELIRPWALSGKTRLIEAAAIAVGVPTALNEPAAVGRRLTRSWIGSGNESLRACAILAYGGPLGAWDLSCGAPVRLWLATGRMDDLQELSCRSLAGLCVAGPDAARIRYAVLTLLAGQISLRPSTARRALRIFSLVVELLGMRRQTHRESFLALLGDAEQPALKAFTLLLAQTWSMPYAKQSAESTVRSLVRAAEDQVISMTMLVDVIRMAKASARDTATIADLGAGLRRGLILERRATPDGTVAARLLSQFFPDPEVMK